MPNGFSKEEVVAFEQMLEGFQDALVLSRNVNIYGTDGRLMERANDTIWRPQPYIGLAQDRIVGSAVQPRNRTQLSVPSRLGFKKNDTFEMDALELRDALQEGRLGQSSATKLASVINGAVLDVASQQGTLVVTRATAPGTFDDVALCDTIMNEQGVPMDERYLALNSRDYNGTAGNLASRQNVVGKVQTAYDRAQIGMVSSFDTYKLDVSRRILAASGGAGIQINTTAAGGNVYVPRATSTAATGEVGNVDNRYQTVTVNGTANVRPGDCFTIAGVNAVHQIEKGDTGQLKTFRVIAVPSTTTLVISPPLITGQGGSDTELEYQNCVVNTPAANSAIVFLNIDPTGYNVFWRKPAIELLPGRYAVPTAQGVDVMRASTDQGIEVVMAKKFDNQTFKSLYTVDVLFGVVMTAPEQCGILLWNQVP
jgi:hypothetical protein